MAYLVDRTLRFEVGMRKSPMIALVGTVVVSFLSGQPEADAQQSLAPFVVAPHHFKLEFENEYVGVIRERTASHDRVPMHEHSLPGVMVLLSDQNIRQTEPDGTVRLRRKSGETYWTAPSTHAGENVGDTVFEHVRVEIKDRAR